MSEKRLAISVPLDGYTLPEHADLAREAERLGYTDAWSFEVDGVDAFAPLAVVGMATRLRLGTAIANVFTRGPGTLAITAAGLAEIAPGRFCLGIGAGSSVIVEAWNGARFAKPATRVREMATFLRQALAGERVVFAGQTFQVDGFRLSRPPAAPVPIHVAALRPGMLRVAGEVGDGVILNWLAPDDVATCVKVARDAAAAAGRDPAAIEVSARLFIHIDPPGPAAEQVARRHIAAYLNVPVYRAYHEWLGRTGALAGMWAAWERGDRKGALAAIPSDVVDALITRGTMADIRARVRQYLDAGLDTAFLSLWSAETDAVKKREAMRAAVRALAPGAA